MSKSAALRSNYIEHLNVQMKNEFANEIIQMADIGALFFRPVHFFPNNIISKNIRN